MKIRVDQRHIDATPIEGAADTMRDLAAAMLEAKLRLARFLAQVDEAKHWKLEGCGSLAEFGARFGIARVETRSLRDLGLALRTQVDLERALRANKTDVARAATVSRILANPALVQPGDDWIKHACKDTLTDLRRRVRARIEEFAQQATGVVEVSVHVRDETKAEFLRARELLSTKEGQVLTYGQTFHRVVNFWLDKNDPERRKPGKRRVPHTKTRPESRYVPAEVVREVLERSEGRCEFPGCHNRMFTELGHIVPHAHGSAREASDFFHFCSIHHKLYDAHLIRFVGGTVEAPIFWVKGVGTICDETVEAGPRKPPPANGNSPPPIEPDGGSSSVVSERTAWFGGRGRYPLFERAFVHC